MRKLFVGGLSWNTDDDQLKSAFEKFGQVISAKVVLDRDTERSRGFGFVEFANEDDAAKARDGMDGTELDGRTLRVDMAKERERRGGGDRGNRKNGKQKRGGRRERQDRY